MVKTTETTKKMQYALDTMLNPKHKWMVLTCK